MSVITKAVVEGGRVKNVILVYKGNEVAGSVDIPATGHQPRIGDNYVDGKFSEGKFDECGQPIWDDKVDFIATLVELGKVAK